MVSNKWKLRLLVVWLVINVVGLIYCVSAMIDHHFDVKTCEKSLGSPEGIECYANDDFGYINFGRNLDCTCFTGSFEELNLEQFVFSIR